MSGYATGQRPQPGRRRQLRAHLLLPITSHLQLLLPAYQPDNAPARATTQQVTFTVTCAPAAVPAGHLLGALKGTYALPARPPTRQVTCFLL
jgi:hypothetical protein